MGLSDIIKSKLETTTTTVADSVTTSTPAQPADPAPKPLKLHKDDSFPWRRFGIALVGIAMVLFVWRWGVNHLYTLPPAALPIYGTMTVATQYSITFIVAFFIFGQAYFTNWSNISTSTITAAIQQIIESRKAKAVEKTVEKKE